MKKALLITFIFTALFSCKKEDKKKTDLAGLTEQKTELVAKIDSLTKELKSVEQQILKLDTNANILTITTLPIENKTFKHFIEVQGVVKSDKNIEITPELGGTVSAIYVKNGQKVTAGQVLVQLDDAAIQSSIAEVSTQLSLAKTTFERQERLWDQKIGSEMQYLQAKTQKESLENNLKTLKTQARKMKIIAPFSGVVDEIFPKKGELTSPQTPIVRLLNLNDVYVETEITESYLPIIKKGTETIVNFPTLHKSVDASISQVSNFINPNNRSFKTRINIQNPTNEIKPNLLADLKILDFVTDGVVIPSTLIQQDQNGNDFVFTIKNNDNQYHVVKKIIDVVNEYDHTAYVSSGLTLNDTLIDSGARLVKEGDIVKID